VGAENSDGIIDPRETEARRIWDWGDVPKIEFE
jgi:hypothetical protein